VTNKVLVSFTLEILRMSLYVMFFLCMLHTYYWGDFGNLIGRSIMMGSEIGITWKKNGNIYIQGES